MDSFLERLLAGAAPQPSATREQPREPSATHAATASPQGAAAPRIAIYDTLTSPPRVVSVEEKDLPALISSLATETYRHCREQGGQVPYTVIRELIENLIHAAFRDVVVTVLDGGQVLKISDHGPGIVDKERAVQPGFTTASAEQRLYIRGVGSGLPIALESLAFLKGVLTIEDNLGGGTVLTINLPRQTDRVPPPAAQSPSVRLSNRQKRILVLLMELGSAGPTQVARELGIAPATAFRDLGLLEKAGLVHSSSDGKRTLTEEGVTLLDSII
jgi:DNA-binding CsgD family transcriptional regulator